MVVHYERARLLFRQGRYDLAERELRDELAEAPHDGQTHAFLGRCLARRNLLAEALEEGKEGVRLAPDLPYTHYMLALTCIDLQPQQGKPPKPLWKSASCGWTRATRSSSPGWRGSSSSAATARPPSPPPIWAWPSTRNTPPVTTAAATSCAGRATGKAPRSRFARPWRSAPRTL